MLTKRAVGARGSEAEDIKETHKVDILCAQNGLKTIAKIEQWVADWHANPLSMIASVRS